RGVLVGEQPHADRDHALRGGQGAERLAIGHDRAEGVALTAADPLGVGLGAGRRRGGAVVHAGRSGGSRTTASRSPRSTQVSVARWQAAPAWSTRTRSVSPSQSRATERAHWTWPLVSPLRQYSPRERDQLVAPPVVRAPSSAS